jgi:hypothetical protein
MSHITKKLNQSIFWKVHPSKRSTDGPVQYKKKPIHHLQNAITKITQCLM